LLASSIIADAPSRLDLPTDTFTVSQIYNDLIVATSSTSVATFTLAANTHWSVTTNASPRVLDCRFNRVFVIDDADVFHAYTLTEGLELWAVQGKQIRDISISYPHIIYISQSGDVGAIDFLTGHLLWENREVSVINGTPIGRTSFVLVQGEDQCQLLDITTGEILSDVETVTRDDVVLFSWNEGAAIQRGDQLLRYTLEEGDLTKVASIGLLDVDSFDQYFSVLVPTSNQIDILNVYSGELAHSYDLEYEIEALAIHHDQLYSIDSEHYLRKTVLYESVSTGNVSLPPFDLSDGFHIYSTDDREFLYTQQDVFELK